MPWQVPITVDGLEYPVTFNTEGEPTQQDYDEAVQQILSQKAQAVPEPKPETPGYLSQLGSALGLGYRQMKSGVGATFNALTGDTADVASEMAEMSKLQREQQAAQTPEDVEFMRSLEEAEKGFEQAQGPLESIGALAQYPAAVFAQPGAAFKTAVQSAPNALISGATSLAGYGLGGLLGGAAGIETGPGAILTGLAGATAGGALSNTLMEAGPSIFDVLNERTQGAASNMTADEIAAYLQQNPDIVDEGLKTGAIRGSVIGAVEALGVKGSGRLLTMPERAAARAVQKELVAQGVDIASKEAVDKALLDPALRASTKAAAETAKNQFSSAGNMARLVGASAIETGAAGAGELAAQAAAGQDISTKEAFLEMMGETALSLPMAATTKALEGAKYMLNPALVSDLGKASAENLAAAGSSASAEAQEAFNEAIELTMLPFTREDIRATEMPFTREDIRATDLPFTREDIRATQLPFGREDIRATEMPFSREDIRGISTPTPAVEEEPQTFSPEMEMPKVEEPLSEGAERNRAIIAEAAAKLRGEAPKTISAGVKAAIPQQPVETQENAPPQIPLEESLRQEPQDRIESREAEETGARGQLLRSAEGEVQGEVVRSPKRQAVESVFNAIQSHLDNGGDFQIPGNPPLRITKKNANQFSVSSDGDLMFKRGKKGGVIPITDVAVIGSQVGSPFDVLSLFEGREVERPVTSDALAIAESDNGASFERLTSLIGDRQKAADEIETLTGKDVFSAWPIVVDAVADSVSVSNGQFVDTEAKAEKLRSLYREAQEMPASRERADAIEQITLASNINQSNRDSIKRKKITPPTETTTATEGMITPGGVGSPIQQTPKGKLPEYQIRAAQGRPAKDADGAPTGWKLNEFRDAIELVSDDASKYVVFPLENPSSYGDKLRALATAENWAIDNPIRAQIEAAPMEANYGAGRVEDVTPKTVKFVHTTKTTPGKGQKSGYYPGTYAYESESGLLPSMEGNKFFGELPESDIYTLKDADKLKKDAADAGFGRHSGNGNSEVKYLQSLGFKAMRRPAMGGTEIIVFDTKDANFQPQTTAAETQISGSVMMSPLVRGMLESFAQASAAWSKAKSAIREQLSGTKEAVYLALAEDDFTMSRNGNVVEISLPKGGSDAFSLGGLGTALDKYFRFGDAKGVAKVSKKAGKPFQITFGNEKDASDFMQYDGRTPSQLNEDFKRIYQQLSESKPQAAKTQTPVPSRNGTGVAGVVQSEPSGGSIPEVAKVSTETETTSSGKLDTVAQIDRLVQSGAKPEEMDKFVKSLTDEQFNELVASEAFDVEPKLAIKPKDTYDIKRNKRRDFVNAVNTSTKEVRKTAQQVFQEEEAAAKRQEKLEQNTKSSLNSIVGPQKKNSVQGAVTKADVEMAREALTNSGEIPNAYLTNVYESREAFLADRVNERLFPATYARLKNEDGIEGLFSDGKTFVFAKDVFVSDLDRKLAKILGVSDEQVAARRVIIHESGHDAISRFLMSEKRELRGYLMRAYSDEQIAKLVEKYTEYADWRTNPESRLEALEELLMRDFEKMEKIPTGGVWDDIIQLLKRIWRRITGQTGEPTLNNLKDVVRLMRNAMKRSGVPMASYTLKDGGGVKLSMIAPTAGITPEMDAEYLTAVEAGDMEKAQRMVDEAAKAAGFNVGPVYHGTNAKFTEFSKRFTKGQMGFHVGTESQANFFSEEPLKLFVRADNPLRLEDTGSWYGEEAKRNVSEALGKKLIRDSDSALAQEIQKSGYDSVVYKNTKEWDDQVEKEPQDSYIVFEPNQIKSADPVTRDDAGNVIPLSQRFQTASPDIRFSRPQYASDYTAAESAGNEAARSTLYSERDMDIREAIRRAYEAMPKSNSVAVPIGELFAKTEELMPGVTQDEFSNVLQDLFEDNGAVLQEGGQITPEKEVEIQAFEKDNPFDELIRKSSEKSPSIGEINGVSKKFVQRVLRPTSSFAANNGVRVDDNAPLQARAMPDGSIIIGYSLPQERFDELQKMAPQAASQYTKDSVIEELIHVSDLIGLRNQWIASGKVIPFDQFVLGEQSKLAFSLIQKADSLNDTEAESLRRILASSLSLYNNNPAIANLGLNELLDLAAQYPYVLPELVRSLIQLKKTGQLTETAFRKIANVLLKWQEIVLQWISDGYSSAKEGVFGEMLSERIKNAENNLAQLSVASEINVTTPEGKRAGFVVVMPRAAKASRIKAEDATEAAKTFQDDIIEAGKGRIDTDSYQGNTLKSTEAPDHNVNAPELYKDAAISLVDSLLKKHSITDIADSFQDPEFRVAVGLLGNKAINPNVAQQAELFTGAVIQKKLEKALNDESDPAKKRLIEKTLKRHKAYYNTSTGIGQNLNAVGALQQDPDFKGMFLFDKTEDEMAEKAKEKLDTITGGGTQPVTDMVNQSEEAAADEATKQIEESVEEDEDAALFSEGEASLQGEAKSIWERMKDILRKIAFLDRLDKKDASSAKASLSKADKNTLSSLPKEERAKKRAEFVAEFIALGKMFMGEGKASDTPAQKATRQKRKKMVDTAKKRAEAGKEIEVTRIQIQSFMDELMPGFTERESIVNEVGDALLKAAEQRKAKPRQRTAIQDFVSAIKQTLMANIRGDKISAEQPSLGMLLAKTFAQQGSEAEAFAAAWANGRKKVRGMLAEMGVEDGNLDAELDAIMPPTPTLAYAPAAARKAVSNAMREAGLMRSDLLNDPAASKKAIMEKFDEAAKSANLTEEGWDKKGRALADKAVDESIAEAKMAQERAKKVAKILSEQAEKPVSLEDFGAKLAEFRFKKDKIAELFNRAKKLAERKIQMANDQAIRVLLAAENKLAQSAFFNASEKPDTIVKAFREQVEEPMERDAFKKRMEKMLVTPEMADKLFDRAARERDNARWKKAQDLLEGPNALQNLLRQMNMARPGEQAPFSKQISWREILSQKAKTVEEYRQRIFDAVSANEAFQNLTDEQKGRLSDLFSEAWESKRTDILDRMLEREIERKRREGSLSEAAAKALQKSRNKIIELANLGGFDNDDLMKVLGEKFGIKTGFSETEKARISELADKLQDETLNPAKRNKLAMEFAVTLAGASEIPVAEIISNWWTSSVLFGPQTIFSIGAAFVNGAYGITTIGTRRMLANLTRGDVKGAIEESILMLQGIAKYLGAFKQAGRRAWSYLWTGNVDVLGAAANDILGEINSLEELKRFKRHKLLAENLAKDPRALRRYVGMYLRFVNRLLTSLDAFNVMVTKAGTASLALRMSGMSTDNIINAEKMLNLKAYKDQVIRDYFDNKAPTTQAEKALVDSYAEAEMYRAIDKLGGKMENADYLASESAMTMNPTGLGGFFYRSITGLDSKMKKAAEDYLEKAKKEWTTEKDLESTLFLGLAYLRQFAVQNLGGVAGYKFIRFASNKFNQGISYLPMVGLLRTLESKGDEIKGKEAFIETIHRNQVIGAVLTLAAIAVVKALEEEPDDEERGNFWNGGWQNLTPDQKKQMLAKGQKEYTMGFKFNGRWYVFNYQNWPLNQVLAAIGSMSDQIRFSPKQWEEKGPLSKSLAGIVSGLKSTLEIPALSQLGELAGNRLASKDPTEQTVDRLSRVAAGWVGGFVPRILKDLDFATQPELRKYKTLWEKTASHIPIYRRYVGEDYYDILGQPIKRNVIPGSREFMMGPTEPEYKILGALNSRNIFLTPANAEYRMVGKGRNRRRLTQEEADAYSLETGKGYRQMLLRYGQRALQMPTERARAFLSDKADEVRDRALKKVFRR